jgi:phage terminase large subunit-like protein
MDGLNVHCALVDELHAHKDSKVWDVLDTATGSRRQPLMLAITTAGFERAVCIEKYNYCEQVLSGIVSDDSIFAFITEMDEGDDWTDRTAWVKANPNLGVSCFEDQLETLCKRAQHIPSEQNNFLTKHLNKWVNQSERWINLDDWKACGGEVNEEELAGRRCYGGLDLSATTDITALVLLFPPESKDEQWKAVYRFWVPDERVQKRAQGYLVDRVPYDAWKRDGFIRTTPGNVIDYDFVRAEIIGKYNASGQKIADGLADLYDIQEIAYDPYNARETAIKLAEAGLEMVEYRQGAVSFNAPMKRFEGLLLERQFNHANNPVLGWMANNMVVRYDANMNMAPDKKSAKDKIDGIVALLMALGLAIVAEDKEGIYNRRGILYV